MTTSPTTKPETTNATTIEHYSIRASQNRRRDPRAKDQERPHLGITIVGCGPASGRARAARRAADRPCPATKIVPAWEWSPWC